MKGLSFGGYNVGDIYLHYGCHRISAIQEGYVYDRFGQAHVILQVEGGKTYWARPLV